MAKTVEILESNAIEAYKNTDAAGKILLQHLFGKKTFKLDVKERIKTMDDVYAEFSIDKEAFEKSFMFPEDLDAAKVRLIIKAFNTDENGNVWVPDWTNSKQTKYFPWFDLSSGVGFSGSRYDHWYTFSSVGSRLAFKSSDLALHAVKQFPTEFENYIIIKK